jgi:hypothetical protein
MLCSVRQASQELLGAYESAGTGKAGGWGARLHRVLHERDSVVGEDLPLVLDQEDTRASDHFVFQVADVVDTVVVGSGAGRSDAK